MAWAADQPVRSAVERVVLARMAGQTGGSGEPEPCRFNFAVSDFVWQHDGVTPAEVRKACSGLLDSGLVVSLTIRQHIVAGTLVCPLRSAWLDLGGVE